MFEGLTGVLLRSGAKCDNGMAVREMFGSADVSFSCLLENFCAHL